MSQEDGGGGSDTIDGMPLETAVARARSKSDTSAESVIRHALSLVTVNGVVTWEGVDDELATLSKVVSTPETRVELAALALEEAREAAASVDDIPTVRSRLEQFQSRLTAVEAEAADLGRDLQALLSRRREAPSLLDVALDIPRLRARANGVQGDADELQLDLEQFGRWLSNPAVRVRDIEGDADELAASLENLDAELATLGDAIARYQRTAGDEGPSGAELGGAWYELSLHHRVQDLVFADLRREVADLRTWLDREPGPDGDTELRDRLDSVENRLDELHERWVDEANRLVGLRLLEWESEYDDRVAAFGSELDALEPPVEWSRVESLLETYRRD